MIEQTKEKIYLETLLNAGLNLVEPNSTYSESKNITKLVGFSSRHQNNQHYHLIMCI